MQITKPDVERFKFKYKECSIQGYKFGNGKKDVLFLPPYPHSGYMIASLLNGLDYKDFTFWTFDIPGWIGNTPNMWEENEFSTSDCTNIALELIKQKEFGRYNILSYSFGTSLAAVLAALDKEHVQSVIFISPVIKSTVLQNSANVKAINVVHSLGLNKLIKVYVWTRFVKYTTFLRRQGLPQEFVDDYLELFKKSDPKVLLDSIYSTFHQDLTAHIAELKDKNVLVINSRNETPMFREQAAIIRRLLDSEKSAFLTGEHHDFLLKPNDSTKEKILAFFRKQL